MAALVSERSGGEKAEKLKLEGKGITSSGKSSSPGAKHRREPLAH